MLPSFTFSNNTVGFLIDGTMDKEAVKNLQEEILERLKEFDKINLYLEDNGIEHFSLPAVMDEILFKIKHGDRFHKVALVTDRKWIKLCGGIENMFLEATIKNFDVEDRIEAISWISRPI